MKNTNIGIIKLKNKTKTPPKSQAPAWFIDWFKEFKKEIDQHWLENNKHWEETNKRLDNIVKKNNLIE